MNTIRENIDRVLDKGRDASLLLIRLVLAYGFYEPVMGKWSDIGAVAQWFGEDLGLPFPLLNAYMAASVESLGVILLVLGLGVRLISLPLMVIMVVAITMVHWTHGFPAGDNGFEIPLYYLLMLFLLLTHGGGRYGIDACMTKKNCKDGAC